MSLELNDEQKRLLQLRKELNYHNNLYYVLNDPEISDYAFDMKMKELESLEAKYPEMFDAFSPTQKVGSDKTDDFISVNHQVPMLSLGNTYSSEEVEQFFSSAINVVIGQIFFTGELKFDGLSLSITYEDNILVLAVTRGDGDSGDDVTDNVKAIPSIPNILSGKYPKRFEVRGEIVMPRAVFEKLNIKKIAAGEQPMANPRNAASGSLKLRNLNEVAKRGLNFMPFQVVGDFGKSHYEAMNMLKQDFDVFDLRLAPTSSFIEMENFINLVEQKRSSLPFDIDGVVFKVDDSTHYEKIGYTSKHPKWATAFKFKAEQVTTKLSEVVYQVGKTGQITPVANLEPVLLAGTIVKRASLHNDDIIKKLDLHIGDNVIVEKGGEIIPQITGVILKDRIPGSAKVEPIQTCPDCGSVLNKKTNRNGELSSNYFCSNNWECPSQIKGKIEYFVSKKCMDIQGIGESTVEELYNKGLIKKVEDLYSLTEETMRKANLDKFGPRKIQIALEGIKESKKQPYHRVLTSLGIDGVGRSASKKLCSEFKSIGELQKASFTDLIETEDIGEGTAQNIKDFFSVMSNMVTIGSLISQGLNFSVEEVKENDNTNNQSLKNKSVVISGNFGTPARRKELETMVEEFGGKLSSSVSKNTNYFVAGEKVGPSKLDKAQANNVPIITEQEFLNLLK